MPKDRVQEQWSCKTLDVVAGTSIDYLLEAKICKTTCCYIGGFRSSYSFFELSESSSRNAWLEDLGYDKIFCMGRLFKLVCK